MTDIVNRLFRTTWFPLASQVFTLAVFIALIAARKDANAPYVGKVLQTLEAGRYTYVEAAAGNDEKIWAAAPTFAVTIGDTVTVPADMPMAPFESKTLGRTFACVYFAGAISVGGQAARWQPVSHFPRQ